MLPDDGKGSAPQRAESEPHWVVRGGAATARQLQDGTSPLLGKEHACGFSVQHELGRQIEELAAAGRFPNAQISIARLADLIAAARSVGYDLRIEKTPGRGFHHDVVVPCPLPDDLAAALAEVFVQRDSPARFRRA